MKQYYAYIRVSTVKQGEHGVSLQQQREAIERYAGRSGLEIIRWFEEQETAAKRGRPLFNQMLRLMAQGHAVGVIIHKIDRSARNLKDWADLGELIDKGIEVHFVTEALDLHSRGGRLSADIQAVVAADYIRNLREETKKGFYGRLKQGLFPMPAPIGYLDSGQGKPKVPDPAKAPLVKMAFELYATGRFNLNQLNQELYGSGLRTRSGKQLAVSALASILHNPFYTGIIRLKKTGQIFAGVHAPIIDKALFDSVDAIFSGKLVRRVEINDFAYRRMLTCQKCGHCFIGERQKGHVYYRCHSQSCLKASVREGDIELKTLEFLKRLVFDGNEKRYLDSKIATLEANKLDFQDTHAKALRIQLGSLAEQLGRATDAYLEHLIEKSAFEERRARILMQRLDLEAKLADVEAGTTATVRHLAAILELATTAYSLYKHAAPADKRQILKSVSSNRLIFQKTLCLSYQSPYQDIAERQPVQSGAPRQGRLRTLELLFEKLVKFVSNDAFLTTFSSRSKRTV